MAINKLKLITNNSQNVWFAFVVSSCPPSFWLSGLGRPSGTADKCELWSSSQRADVDMHQRVPVCRQCCEKWELWKNWGEVSMGRGQSSWLQGKYCWPCHCVGMWWRIYFTASLMSITVWEERPNCLLHCKQKIALLVEITDLQLRKAQTGHCRVMTMLELISRGKSIAKIACFKSAFSATGFMHTA